MLVLTTRVFDFKDDYENFNALHRHPKDWNVSCQRAYLLRRGGGHPADHYPCKTAFAETETIKTASSAAT